MIGAMILGLAQQVGSPGAPADDQSGPVEVATGTVQEVVVTGKRRRGSIDIGIEPTQSLDAEALQSLGATDLKSVMDRVGASARSADGQPPIMVINGRMPVDPFEVYSLPYEAVERVDTYPEQAAAKFGYPPTRKVMNYVFKPRFFGVSAEGRAGTTTDGGRTAPTPSLSVARIRDDLRTSVRARYRRAAELEADARPIVRDPAIPAQQSDGVSLAPVEEEVGLNGTFARSVGKASNGSLAVDVERKRSGLAAGFSSADAAAVTVPAGVALRRRSVETRASVASAAAGSVHGWGWNASLKAQTREERTRLGAATPEVSDGVADRLFTGAVTTVESNMGASRVAFITAAGSATITGSFRTRWDQAEAGTAPGVTGAVRRLETGGALGTRVPLISASGPFAAFLGDIALNARAEVSSARTDDLFFGGSGGIEWQLIRPVRLSMTAGYARTLPDIAILATPRVETPNVPFFDFTRGETGLVTTIAGGNPNLRPARRRTLSATAEVKPFAERDFQLTASYLASDTRDAVGSAVALTADSQAIFPDLFVRDAAGRVRIVRQSPVNLFRSTQDQIDLGFTFQGQLGPEPDPAAKGQRKRRPYLYLNGTLSYRLTDSVRLAPGAAVRDLLAGATIDGLLGRPATTASGFAAIFHRGVGANLSVDWQGRSRILGSDPSADLTFAPLLKLSPEAWVSLDQVKPKWRWAKRMLIGLEAKNITNARVRVTDRTGQTPYRYQPSLIDPIGRTVSLRLRKIF